MTVNVSRRGTHGKIFNAAFPPLFPKKVTSPLALLSSVFLPHFSLLSSIPPSLPSFSPLPSSMTSLFGNDLAANITMATGKAVYSKMALERQPSLPVFPFPSEHSGTFHTTGFCCLYLEIWPSDGVKWGWAKMFHQATLCSAYAHTHTGQSLASGYHSGNCCRFPVFFQKSFLLANEMTCEHSCKT